MSTEIVVIVADDVDALPGAIEKLTAALEAHPDVRAVGGRVVLSNGTIESCGGDYQVKDGVITFTPLAAGLPTDAELEATTCRWLPPAFLAVRGAIERLDETFRTVPDAVALRRGEPKPMPLAGMTRFYRKYGLVPKDLFALMPELTGTPAARLLLELADARGEEWIAEQQAAGGLAPLFRKQRKRPLAWWEKRPAK
jgi:hypothetical protein